VVKRSRKVDDPKYHKEGKREVSLERGARESARKLTEKRGLLEKDVIVFPVSKRGVVGGAVRNPARKAEGQVV